MAEIVLTTLNARFAHASFGLRYLRANLSAMVQQQCVIHEFEISQQVIEIAEALLSHRPRIVGIGVYIWNAEQTTKLVRILRQLQPELIIVLGGPEVSYETNGQEIAEYADYVITGEADLTFAALCEELLSSNSKTVSRSLPILNVEQQATGRQVVRLAKIIESAVPDLAKVKMPYDLYDQRDIEHRVIYVEASRGCPFSCEFCLSSLEIPVRSFPLDEFLAAMKGLFDRGVRQFKFVDRTFNINITTAKRILSFFFERLADVSDSPRQLFLHFEMIPDRLPEELRGLIEKFPAGTLQFEVGIQTFNGQVAKLISRKQDVGKVQDNLAWLRDKTGVYVHADLIVGLPGESMESFGEGFDRLVAMRPHEIQIELLKRLRGTPIIRHDQEWEMKYSHCPPYEILSNKLINFSTMQRLRRFARYWDLLANNGNFSQTIHVLLGERPFARFLAFADWLYAQTRQTHGISLQRLTAILQRYLIDELGLDRTKMTQLLLEDYQRTGRSDIPRCLRLEGADAGSVSGVEGKKRSSVAATLPPRQARRTQQ